MTNLWLKWLVAARTTEPVVQYVVHMVDKMALGEVSFQVVWFSTVIVIPQLLLTHIRLSTIGLIRS